MNPEMNNAHRNLKSDILCICFCSLIPVGIVLGTVAFEGFIALAGLSWIYGCIVHKRNPLPRLKTNDLFTALLIFNAAIYLSILINGPGDKGLLNDLAYLRFLILAVALMDVSGRVSIQKYVILGLLSAVVLGALNSMAAHAFGYDMIGKPLSRYTGKGNEAARIAGVCSFAAPFFLSWSVLGRNVAAKYRWMLFAIFVVCVPLIIKTGIRTLIITLSIAALWIFILYIRKKLSLKWAAIPVLAIIAISIFIVKTDRIRLYSFWDRIHIWSINYDIWKKHPIFGVGPFSYASEYETTMTSARPDQYAVKAPDGTIYNNKEVTTHAHNLLIMLLTTTGICGSVSFIWLFILCTRTILLDAEGWRIGLITWPVVLCTIGLTGYNIFDPWYQSLFTFFLIMIGATTGQAIMKSEELFKLKAKPLRPESGQ